MRAAIAMQTPRRLLRVFARRMAAVLLRGLLLLAAVAVSPAAQAAIKGEVKLTREAGFTRLAFRFDEQVGIEVTQSSGIVILTFARPVDIAVEQLAKTAPDLIGAARRDPDGSAVRIALARKMKPHGIPAAERFFLDLLPETWSGLTPGAPQEVVDELARRAREAEQRLRERSGPDKSKETLSGRVKIAVQPTFTRFVFGLPAGVEVAPDRHDAALTLRFNRPIRWDLADAKAAMPAKVSGLETEIDGDSSRVDFALRPPPAAVRSFHEEHAFIVDIDSAEPAAGQPPAAAPAPTAAPVIAAPQSIPADKPAAEPPPPMPVEAALQQPVEPPPAPPATQTPSIPKPDAVSRPARDPKAPVAVELQETGGALTLTFPFAAPTPAAIFRRADVLWLVFDGTATLDLGPLKAGVPGIRNSALMHEAGGATVLRLRLDRPRLVSAVADGSGWIVTIADSLVRPPLPIGIARSVVGRNRANIVIPFARASRVHRLRDPEIGDRLIAVTALAPARGLLKGQNFIEMRALASAQGIAVQPIADDIEASIAPDAVMLSRPGGLSLSATGLVAQPLAGAATFDPQVWGYDRNAPFASREAELIRAAADAPEGKRWDARLNLARFYLARDMAVEAKGVLDVALAGPHSKEDVTGSILRAISDIALQRPAEALKELAAPQIGTQQNAGLWRAIALVRQGKWTMARDGFKNIDAALATLPVEMQRLALVEALRAAVETRDSAASARLIEELETIGVPAALQAEADVLAGRCDEELGRKQKALAKYRAAASSNDARAAAQGRLREIALRLATGDLPRKDAIAALETLTAVWRGDDTEMEGLRLLAQLYRQDSRFRMAFHVMRTAVLAHPDADLTRKIQEEAAASFQALFLSGEGDALPPVEALGLFYDYRELTPIGRLGDEMIRRLADRLIAVDLLGQAAELLQHQVDNRLQGAARAQVAAKLTTIYLMNRKPERALAALRATRDSDVSNELRQHRLLLEARALSELGRQPLALEIVADIATPEAIRLRADVLWSAKRWRESAEAIERLHGERWRDFKPLNEGERADILRAAIGYALADESIGLARIRERYSAKMAEGPDGRAFDVVSSPIGTAGPEFQTVARRVATADTLAAFLREIRARYDKQEPKEMAEQSSAPAAASAAPPKHAPPPPSGGAPLRPDPQPTGMIGTPQAR